MKGGMGRRGGGWVFGHFEGGLRQGGYGSQKPECNTGADTGHRGQEARNHTRGPDWDIYNLARRDWGPTSICVPSVLSSQCKCLTVPEA